MGSIPTVTNPKKKKINRKKGYDEKGRGVEIQREKNKDKYISPRGDKYVIYKRIPSLNKRIYFGTFETLHEAREYRDFLEEHDWDTKYIKRKRDKHAPPGEDTKYITFYKCNQKWVVNYYRDGKHYYFGCFDSFEEAREERDFWESIDWNLDLIDLY